MQKDILIVHSPSAEGPELNAVLELQQDLARTTENPVYRISAQRLSEFNTPKQLILVGLQDSHPEIQQLIAARKCQLSGQKIGDEGFVLESVADGKDNILIITAGDVRGLFYGVYEFSSRVLHIDPFEFWTGKKAPNSGLLELPELAHFEPSPVFPLRGYFDNDNDMLSNWSGRKLTVEFETWKEMIDSLARLRYNYIDLHDTLGRAEFWYWEYYKEKFDYHTDLDLIEKLIDYIHGKGMLVQIPLYLGWEFYHLPYEKVALSKYHDDWMTVYEHYLKNTPLGKGDLFLQRPRDPWWDYAYNVPEEKEAGIKTGPLMNKMFAGLNALIKKYRPEAKLICDLWMEGREMWDAGEFDPDMDIDMLWADDGYAVFSEWPTDFKGHKYGVYVHAGFYLNHVMQDPYPARLKAVTLEAVKRGMTHNYFVNGQDFKHFLLNLEVCGKVAWNPEAFDPDAFYHEWTGRYFGEAAAAPTIESLKLLNQSHDIVTGFTYVMRETERVLDDLEAKKYRKVDIALIEKALSLARESLVLAQNAAKNTPAEAELVFDDQIGFPARIFVENLELNLAAANWMNAVNQDKLTAAHAAEVLARLNTLRQSLIDGSKWEKWQGWTHPDNFRIFTPPPTVERINHIAELLKKDNGKG